MFEIAGGIILAVLFLQLLPTILALGLIGLVYFLGLCVVTSVIVGFGYLICWLWSSTLNYLSVPEDAAGAVVTVGLIIWFCVHVVRKAREQKLAESLQKKPLSGPAEA